MLLDGFLIFDGLFVEGLFIAMHAEFVSETWH